MVECVGTLERNGLLLRKHWDNGGYGQDLVRDWFARGLATRDPFHSFMYVWFAFNGWAERVTDEDKDWKWLEIVGVDARLRTEFREVVSSNRAVAEAVGYLHAFAPIFRFTDQRKFDPPPGYRRDEHVKYWLTKEIAGKRLDHRPRCYEDDLNKAGRMEDDWPHILQAIYGVRCNLFHGSKSTANEEDMMLVVWGREILVEFLSKGGYLGYRDPKS